MCSVILFPHCRCVWTDLLGVLGGVVDGLHDGGVLGVEGHGLDQHSTVQYSGNAVQYNKYSTVYLDELVHLVPQLGGGQVVVSSHGALAGGTGHAAQLLLVTPGVKKEAHACR